MRKKVINTNQKRAEKYYRTKYGSISPELKLVINKIPNEPFTLTELINTVEWAFECEWDCSIEEANLEYGLV